MTRPAHAASRYANISKRAAIKDRKPSTTFAAVVGLLFVLWAFYGSGLEAFLLSLGLLVAGGVIFLVRKPRIGPAEAQA